MHRFWRMVTGLLIGFALGLGALLVIIRSAGPLSPYMSLFRNPDGSVCARPCIFGIRTGETPWEEALALLRAHPVTRDLLRRDLTTRLATLFEGEHVVVMLDRDVSGEHIRQINVQINPTFIQRFRGEFAPLPALPDSPLRGGVLGEVIAALGPPDYMQMYNTGTGPGRLIRLHYQAAHLTLYHARRSPDRVTVRDDFDMLSMYTVPAEINPSLFLWSGFTTFDRYNDLAGRKP